MESSTPPSMVTANDLDIIIEGWERKFEHLSQCMREIQLASEKANSNMNNIVRDGRAREGIQERRIEEMHVGLTQFLERCDPAHLTAPRRFDAPAASTPFTPTGVPSRLRLRISRQSGYTYRIYAQQHRPAQHRSAQHRSAQHRSAQHRSAQPRPPRR